jgi:hypothetical protein
MRHRETVMVAVCLPCMLVGEREREYMYQCGHAWRIITCSSTWKPNHAFKMMCCVHCHFCSLICIAICAYRHTSACINKVFCVNEYISSNSCMRAERGQVAAVAHTDSMPVTGSLNTLPAFHKNMAFAFLEGVYLVHV